MKTLLFLLCLILLSGCAFEDQLSSKTYAKEVKLNKLSIRQIDSLTAEANYYFSVRNKIEIK